MNGISRQWKESLATILRAPDFSAPLREASLLARLDDWTKALTGAAVRACHAMGWEAAAKGFKSKRLPQARHEYLSLDVMAFPGGDCRWCFPAAVMELENSQDDDRIAYSLWKVLCVRTGLRIVFSYRKAPESGPALISFLKDEVISAMTIDERETLAGETVVVIGSRAEAETFPYGFFNWWVLDKNLGRFHLM
jgi:hypothetical protein